MSSEKKKRDKVKGSQRGGKSDSEGEQDMVLGEDEVGCNTKPQPEKRKKRKKRKKKQKTVSDKERNEGEERTKKIVDLFNGPSLMVGAGNFSFARALVQQGVKAENLTVTELKPESELDETAKKNKKELEDQGVTVELGVNATALKKSFPEKEFDFSLFHFPHTGGDPESNRNLVEGYYRSSKEVLSDKGKAGLTLSTNRHYNRFGPKKAAENAGLEEDTRLEFVADDFPSYTHAQTRESEESASTSDKGRMYVLKKGEKKKKKKKRK